MATEAGFPAPFPYWEDPVLENGKYHDQVGYLQWLKNFLSRRIDTRRGEMKYQREAEYYNVQNLLFDLKSCTIRRDLQSGRRIHAIAMESTHGSNTHVLTALVRMYTKCGSMTHGRSVFESIQNPDVVSWTALLQGYAESGDGITTLELFSKMKASGCAPDCVTYVAVLKACTSLAKRDSAARGECLKRGREIHSEIKCNLDIFLQNTLIDMYATCGSMIDACRVFNSIRKPDVVSWTAVLMGYAENGEGLATLDLFSKMKASGCAPNSVTYVAAIKACTSLAGKGAESLKRGREIHSEIGSNLNIFVQNVLTDMYAKCGSMVDARRVFDGIQMPDVIVWNALLQGYFESGDGPTTLDLFSRMKTRGCPPNSISFVAAIKACSSLTGKRDDCLKRGREIHSQIGSELNIFVQNTLIDMYANCGSMDDARCVFDSIQNPSVVSWNALLLGYVDHGEGLVTLKLFSKMKACECTPDSVTYVAALKACVLVGALDLGRKFHSEMSNLTEFTSNLLTCLIDFYAKCGSIIEAREVFDAHKRVRSISTWTALLTGYGSFGDTISVFNLFEVMQNQGFQPDSVTFVCMLSCCGHAGLVEKAREYLEAMPIKYGVTPTVMHYTCMVDVLGRANQLDEAIALLRNMPCKADAVCWITLLGACRKWKNVEIGRCAFRSLMGMDKKNALAYALMAHIYGSKGMWEEQERVLEASVLQIPPTN